MSTAYTVRPGDNLSAIARRHGLSSWRAIYDHPDNAAFRRRRPNPNLIHPGDVVMIPDGAAPGPSPAPPTPTPPGPQSAIERDIETYLTSQRRSDPAAFVARQLGLVLLGEAHVGHATKAAFLATVARAQTGAVPTQAVFHASEHYINDPATQVAIQNFVFASAAGLSRARLHLPALVRPYEPVLEVARQTPGHRLVILAAGSTASDEDPRHGAIHTAFNNSIARHNTLHSLNTISLRSRGHFLIGANHGARRHTGGGSTPTTCERLIRDGWRVIVVRFTINRSGGVLPDGTIVGGEGAELEPLGGTGPAFDLLPILNRVAAGSPFHADLRQAGSPFARVRMAGLANTPYNDLFDFLVHLP